MHLNLTDNSENNPMQLFGFCVKYLLFETKFYHTVILCLALTGFQLHFFIDCYYLFYNYYGNLELLW